MRLYYTDENKKRQSFPSKFHEDGEGNYWEQRGELGGRKFYVPAPEWAGNINSYLFEGPNIFIGTHKKPLCPGVPILKLGSISFDGGPLILTDDEKNELLRTDPLAEKFIVPFMNGKDFIHNIKRWCLWMVGVEPADIRKCPRVLERIERVRDFRLSSKRAATKKLADTPTLFGERRYSETDYLAVPIVSSERRRYIPIAWASHEVIPGGKMYFCSDSTLYQFGIMNLSVHMAWVRKISGRLKSDYSYSNTLDYNAFPWPQLPPPPVKRGEPPKIHPIIPVIEKTAQAILDARSLYPKSSLADLYDERTMPPELRKAHKANDDAVMAAYEFERHYDDDRRHDEDIVVRLMFMYQELTGCEEIKTGYPNRDLWLSVYGEDEDYEDSDDL